MLGFAATLAEDLFRAGKLGTVALNDEPPRPVARLSPTLLLLDGNSLTYRAFYALPTDMATASGQVTNAVFGFTSMLISMVKDQHPDGLMVAFDRPEPTFRHEANPLYKAQREASPDILRQQMGLVREVLTALNVRWIELAGWEADEEFGLDAWTHIYGGTFDDVITVEAVSVVSGVESSLDTDQATIEEEYALELRARDRERKLLKKIEQSIGRIDAGDYGYCDETGEPIGVGRLLARPTATLSLEAQERRELKQKMFGD
mgnify:CR=1 FL=1